MHMCYTYSYIYVFVCYSDLYDSPGLKPKDTAAAAETQGLYSVSLITKNDGFISIKSCLSILRIVSMY